jgi:hypothetical protein
VLRVPSRAGKNTVEGCRAHAGARESFGQMRAAAPVADRRWLGDALNGWVRYFILDQGGRPASRTGSGPEFCAVDKFGNIFAGEPRPRVLRKYVKVR